MLPKSLRKFCLSQWVFENSLTKTAIIRHTAFQLVFNKFNILLRNKRDERIENQYAADHLYYISSNILKLCFLTLSKQQKY